MGENGPMERLNGLDATFLYAETPSNQLHMTGVLVFDPSTMPGGYSYEGMREFMRGRLGLSPAFTRKLVRVPFDLAHPVWVEDPDFDLEAHLHRVALPSPGGPRQLAELTEQIAGIPLDRGRPLWEMWFVEGLEHGHVGLVAKMHHSTIDGVSGANLMMHLFDLEPRLPEPAGELPTPERIPSDLELLAHGLASRARQPLILPRAVADTARAGFELVRRRLRSDSARMATPFTAPATPFNAPITPHRRIAFSSVPLADVRAVKDAFGTTVNDVILALCAGAVRRWLEDRDALPDRPLIAGVPVSTRGDDDAPAASAPTSSRPCSCRWRRTWTTPSSGCAASTTGPRGPRRSSAPSGPTCSPTGPSSPAPGCSAWPSACTRAWNWPTVIRRP